ncbi:YobI family P-loop NTPase [Mesomycoplasma hyorhinis]
MLINSKANVVVFEDLYRFDNINILIKLIELNFIVNLQTKWSKIS